MLKIDPQQIPTADLHQYLLGAVAPRPIAFVSTLSADGTPNLAPYSFFNAYSSCPPIVVFSSNRRVRDNTTKDTLANIAATGEVVINVVNHAIVYQMALASIEYPPSVSEFDKAGLTPLASERVRPYRVKESPVQMECAVRQVLPLGDKGGAGNLIICEIVCMHINPDILDTQGKIDPYKIDLMARMGGPYYCRVVPESVMDIRQPVERRGIGMDGLPEAIRHSDILTGNDLARLATVVALPQAAADLPTDLSDTTNRHYQAQQLIRAGNIEGAWQVLLAH